MSGHQKIVLLVEDEPLVAMIAGDIMEDLGYQVLDARTASEALAVLATEKFVTLLFTDIDLADGSSGIDLAKDFARLHPGVPIVVTSGRVQPTGLPAGARFLPKPYTEHDLAKAVRRGAGVSRHRHELAFAAL